jgi:hypothetical protein
MGHLQFGKSMHWEARTVAGSRLEGSQCDVEAHTQQINTRDLPRPSLQSAQGSLLDHIMVLSLFANESIMDRPKSLHERTWTWSGTTKSKICIHVLILSKFR